MANTVTNITILSNGTYSPNGTIFLGNKYEHVGDSIVFTIPSQYAHAYHYYLTFKMPRKETILLPVNTINDELVFFITATITQYAGTYDMVFLATESEIVDGDIDEARLVFVSNVMKGTVSDNFLTNPVNSDTLDENLQILYDDMLDVYEDFKEKLEEDGFVGPYYLPAVDPSTGVISWTRSDNKHERIPDPVNITGPTGPYYVPSITDGILEWTGSSSRVPAVTATNVYSMVATATQAYLTDQRIHSIVDPTIETTVETKMDERFQWVFDPVNKILYITAIPVTPGNEQSNAGE